MTKAFFVTGVSGAIGKAVAGELSRVGAVIGLDRVEPDEDTNKLLANFVRVDLTELVDNEQELTRLRDLAQQVLKYGDYSLKALVNVAAIQQLGALESISLESLKHSYTVNCVAPVALSQIFFEDMAEAHGVVVNIGSIHAKLTKSGFGAYAATKAALASLTRTMALDWGGRVRAVCIEPAAIDTDMLLAGFQDNPVAYQALQMVHPSGRIGHPSEVAKLVRFLASDDAPFINGQTIGIDGGIAGRLHDPC